MCGFTGLVSIDKRVNKNDLIEMTNSLDHRGPNSKGIWISESNEIGMGHTRLAILDTSDAGAQPMFSKNQQFKLFIKLVGCSDENSIFY